MSTSDAGSFLSLMIFEKPPLDIMIKLKQVQSCELSNLIVFDRDMRECKLISSNTNKGLSECVYRCSASCSPIITIGFQVAKFGSQAWKICEIAEVRNMFHQIHTTSYLWIPWFQIRPGLSLGNCNKSQWTLFWMFCRKFTILFVAQ